MEDERLTTQIIEDLPKKKLKAALKGTREAWDECFGRHIEGQKNWKRHALLSHGVTALAICGAIYLGTLPKQTVLVVRTDSNGNILSAAPANQTPLTEQVWDDLYTRQLEAFVEEWRTVTSDKTFRDANWDKTFAVVGGGTQANAFLNTWFAEHDPTVRAGKGETVTVAINLHERLSETTYALWWTETSSLSAQTKTSQKYRARITFAPLTDNKTKFLITEIALEEVH